MKKILLFTLMVVLSYGGYAQSHLKRGVIVGNTDNAAQIDSIIVSNGKWVAYKDGGVVPFDPDTAFSDLTITTPYFNRTSTPGTPIATQGVLYMSSDDNKIYWKNNTTTYDLTSGTIGDTIQLDTLAEMLIDTAYYDFNLGEPLLEDGAILDAHYVFQDSAVPRLFKADLIGSAGDSANILIKYSATGINKGSPTTVMSAKAVGYNSGEMSSTDFLVSAVPNNSWIWAEADSISGVSMPDRIFSSLGYSQLRSNAGATPSLPPSTTCSLERWLMENSGAGEEALYNLTAQSGATFSNTVFREGSYAEDNTSTGAYMSVPSIDYGSQFSISMWVYYTEDWAGSLRTLFAAQDGTNGDGFTLVLDGNNDWLRFYTRNSSGSNASAYGPMASESYYGAWHHVVVVVDKAAGEVALYLNNNPIATATTCRTDFSTAQAGTIGHWDWTGYGGWANAYLDDVQVYKWLLSPSDVTYLYGNGGGEVCE